MRRDGNCLDGASSQVDEAGGLFAAVPPGGGLGLRRDDEYGLVFLLTILGESRGLASIGRAYPTSVVFPLARK
jgi:hypothetical protein